MAGPVGYAQYTERNHFYHLSELKNILPYGMSSAFSKHPSIFGNEPWGGSSICACKFMDFFQLLSSDTRASLSGTLLCDRIESFILTDLKHILGKTLFKAKYEKRDP